ncbi:unnamed protein product [Medioppia subpectinata]|uniref:TATA box binding protein associated factor (TAF) histone-like fold domain-containing protein n=1 Tax=Medioppia subpectinata TaxID=1979941 RepID=A0A7R9KJT0_9ACAR|nr:unnamed protein product [Medioppia subpectinata]CAG2104703.1 unnamed protein product [Medioppia subpectinata]
MGLDKTLTDEALLQLSSDVSYRLRQLVANAMNHMTRQKTRRLTTGHVRTALAAQHSDDVLGFDANDSPIDTVLVKEAKVFVYTDPVVDLHEEMNKMFDKTVCDIKVFKTDKRLGLDWISVDSTVTTSDGSGLDLSDEHKAYYHNVMKAILGTDEQLFIKMLRDLSSNCRLNPVLPYLLNFILNGIKRLSHDISQLKRFLNTIECLLRNASVFLATDPYLKTLIQSILKCIIEELNPVSDHWSLRDSASHLLVKVFNERFSQFVVNRLKKQTFDCLLNCLLDSSKPFGSHYGAIKAFQCLGYDIIIEHLSPILNQYFNHLLPAIDYTIKPELRREGLVVFGELLFIAELICLKTRSLIESSAETKVDFKLYTQLSDIFGDSLYARLPIDCHKIRSKFYSPKTIKSTKRPISLFETQESLQTGEQLLDAFYEAPTHTEDMRSDYPEDSNSCANSVISDIDRECVVTDVLQIKSTISDPTLGVKLTIKKLRRDEKETQMAKRISRGRQSYSEPVFESVSIKQTTIRFNISGQSISDVFEKPRQCMQYYPSQWFLLTMITPNAYCLRNKFKLRKCEQQLSLYSCDLLNVL